MDGVAVRPWWRVESRLTVLYIGELIERDAYERACALRHASERVSRTGNSVMARLGVGTGRTPPATGSPSESQLDAARRIERVRERLGERDFAIVHWVVVEDCSWRALGRRLGCDRETAKNRAVLALKRLAKTS